MAALVGLFKTHPHAFRSGQTQNIRLSFRTAPALDFAVQSICLLELDLKESPMNNVPADVMLLHDKCRWSPFKGRIELAAN